MEFDEMTDEQKEERFYLLEQSIVPFAASVEMDIKRNKGVTIHHSYVPEIPKPDVNYANIFNRFHFWENHWQWGLAYDIVLSWQYAKASHNMTEENITLQEWTSYRWTQQINGSHSLNPKHLVWPKSRELIRPNTELFSICVVGNYDNQTVPNPIKKRIVELVELYEVRPIYFFHSDFEYKTCPGTKWNKSWFVNHPGDEE